MRHYGLCAYTQMHVKSTRKPLTSMFAKENERREAKRHERETDDSEAAENREIDRPCAPFQAAARAQSKRGEATCTSTSTSAAARRGDRRARAPRESAARGERRGDSPTTTRYAVVAITGNGASLRTLRAAQRSRSAWKPESSAGVSRRAGARPRGVPQGRVSAFPRTEVLLFSVGGVVAVRWRYASEGHVES